MRRWPWIILAAWTLLCGPLGLWADRSRNFAAGDALVIATPLVWLAMVAWERRILAARRRADHPACATCSYDLTGNASGVCPECGTKVG